MKQLPYNTGKVRIGCRYDPPPPRYYFSIDEERLQRALLGLKRPRVSLEYWGGLWILIAALVIGLVMAVR